MQGKETPAAASPLVSVVIPVLNGGSFLAEALASAVAQTYARFELIVVDGGSTDRSEAIARGVPQVRWLRQTGVGLWNAFNEGIEAAAGEFVAFLSSDDLWMRDKLRLQVDALLACAEIECVAGRVRFVRIENEPLPAAFRRELLAGEHVGYMPEVLLVRRRLFDAIGMLDERLQISADIDWLARLREAEVPTFVVPQVLLHKRIHANNLSSLPSVGRALQRELLQIVAGKLARRRARQRA